MILLFVLAFPNSHISLDCFLFSFSSWQSIRFLPFALRFWLVSFSKKYLVL